jgi:hypothetical protein
MNRLSHYFIKFFYCTLITTASLQCCALKITDLPQDYQHQCYMDIYENRSYKLEPVLIMQLYKSLSQKKLIPDTIKIIFSLCCTRPFFSQCPKNCETHDKVLNRGFPEFPSFKIINFLAYDSGIPQREHFEITLNKGNVTEQETKDSIKRTLIENGLTYSKYNQIIIRNVPWFSVAHLL